ncbi:MAG: helix-hairpin-helix domain-containing protein [bacterium]|nr:helix-hairpin-helix domain-containing protein [bacterium]
MDEYLSSFRPLLKKYLIEICFIGASVICIIISLTIYSRSSPQQTEAVTPTQDTEQEENNSTIYVDLAGYVAHPDVYEISSGTRLKELLILAGGLAKEADAQYFARNFNLAKVLIDQEKIYIPSNRDISPDIQEQTLSDIPSSTEISMGNMALPQSSKKISINSSSSQELDILSGVGKVTADKIINGRPYQNIQELLDKKIVSKSVFSKIQNAISL